MNKVGLLEYAQLFARHIEDESQARRLETHVPDDRPWTNHVSRVLYTLINTHEQTELDVKRGAFLLFCSFPKTPITNRQYLTADCRRDLRLRAPTVLPRPPQQQATTQLPGRLSDGHAHGTTVEDQRRDAVPRDGPRHAAPRDAAGSGALVVVRVCAARV